MLIFAGKLNLRGGGGGFLRKKGLLEGYALDDTCNPKKNDGLFL